MKQGSNTFKNEYLIIVRTLFSQTIRYNLFHQTHIFIFLTNHTFINLNLDGVYESIQS